MFYQREEAEKGEEGRRETEKAELQHVVNQKYSQSSATVVSATNCCLLPYRSQECRESAVGHPSPAWSRALLSSVYMHHLLRSAQGIIATLHYC